MTLKELAHAAQQSLQTRAGCVVKRSHVHELLAAAFRHSSWAAFLSESVLADGGVGDAPAGAGPRVIGRAVQLQYAQGAAVAMAGALLAFVAERQLSSVRWSDLAAMLTPATRAAVDDGLDEADEWDDDDDEVTPDGPATGLTRDRLLRSPLLLHSLEHAAGAPNPRVHHLVAALYRCERPNAYLYEESLKGRVLTTVERGWVDDYLRLEPQFRKYEAHLKAAALGGVRAAALEYAAAFDSQAFFELAERLSGDVDADRMAEIAATPQSRAAWLRTAAEQGSRSALEQLAHKGDEWAEERLAESGDADWLRSAAERALTKGDALKAWTWQYLALKHGVDLTESTMAAYHDGGERDGQFYDSDFGGALYAAGYEALALPQLGPVEHRDAQARAREIFGRTP
ncbi:hypothetical protein GCM10028796_06310 [Ramlibacter monticola]|uniref:Uncharacterized protein n=1 Tax=Ramlibacter monticola TaxID=1926872 RepID=A0A936YX51_9BURK|nr:hypothetical protein [Ramlibacter monticola]MBL0391100.1 hypothetical protein [Ramlibacter monticola]